MNLGNAAAGRGTWQSNSWVYNEEETLTCAVHILRRLCSARISQQTEPVTYWGGPAARPRVWSGWAIKQLVAFLNLSILLSTHCTHIVLDGSSLRPQYSIGSDCIVPGSSADINCLTRPLPAPHTWSNWSHGSCFYCTSDLQVIGHLLLSPPWFYHFSVETKHKYMMSPRVVKLVKWLYLASYCSVL